jgi:hypothetical protein
MVDLNIPEQNIEIKSINSKNYIFDLIRKKHLVLTPEEWVRQNFIKYLISKNYPKSLINCEKSFYINKVLKRYDIVVYDKNGKVSILVECKSPNINIIKEHFDQVMRYNIELKSKMIIVTNGLNHFYFKLDKSINQYTQEKDLIYYNK